MKIKVVRNSEGSRERIDSSNVVVVRISGAIDANDPIVKRARELVETVDSGNMVKSFDWAVANNAFSRDK